MTQFNYFVISAIPIPSVYYFSIPNISTIDPPPPETTTQLNSESNIRPIQAQKSRLELSRAQLMAAGYEKKKKVWTSQEDEELLELIGEKGVPWKEIHLHMEGRTEKMCYSRYRRLLAQARQRWAPQQLQKLKELVEEKGEYWKQFVKQFPNRTWKQIRDKYVNYLRPGINKDQWSLAEDMKILDLLKRYGTKWKTIQKEMKNRTDNQIKNRYYGRLKVLLKRKARKRSRV